MDSTPNPPMPFVPPHLLPRLPSHNQASRGGGACFRFFRVGIAGTVCILAPRASEHLIIPR